jgi:tetratricopeptide (TPR) repeat protein
MGPMMMIMAAAQAAAAPAAAPLQQQFEQASNALAEKQWQQAEAGFAAIAARPNVSPRTRGIALLRRGQALSYLGRRDDAIDLLRQGLALIPRSDATLADDRITSLLLLGSNEIDGYDYVAGRRTLEQALAETEGATDKVAVLFSLIQATMFTDADAALRLTPADDRKLQVRAHDRRGRVLLNRGDLEGARVEMEAALQLAGGLTSKTDLDDMIIRSDLSIVLLLLKRETRARELVAMTGAGRAAGEDFGRPSQYEIPDCAENLRPDDVAVVEFGVLDSGDVFFAQPVYASRPGMPVTEFARAVRSWAWRPDEIKSVPAFFRTVTRVEMRCSTATRRPPVTAALQGSLEDWLAARGVAPIEGELTPAALNAPIPQRDGRDAIAALPLLVARSASDLVSFADRIDAADRAAALGRVERAPVAAQTLLDLNRLALADVKRRTSRTIPPALRALLDRPDVAADATARSVVTLVLADTLKRSDPAQAEALLRMVAEDSRLEAQDPLRTGANVRLAALQAEAGRVDDARRSFAATGLNAQQCALVDAQPDMKRSGMGSSIYPAAAMQWGTSGWSRAEFDIAPDGHTLNQRAVLSYPPFVFSQAVVTGAQGARYTQTYRPDGSLGCGGMGLQVRFVHH